MSAADKLQPNQRLGSWKEIAAFFGCDERTLRRWEKERGLPVHRVPGGRRGKVFAFTNELSSWLASSQPREDSVPSGVVDANPVPVPSPDLNVQASPRPVRKLRLPITVFALAILVFFLFYRIPSSRQHAGPPAAPISAGSSTSVVMASAASPDPEAEKLYLQGRYYWNQRTPDSLNKAVDDFTQAIVHDPHYALAYVGLADSYNLLREYAGMPPSEAYARSLAAARKAVELDDHSSDAHASLAFALFYGQWDVAGAEKEFRRALELNPNNSAAHHWYATYLMTLRRFPESLAEIQSAQTLDPHSASILADRGLILVISGRTDEGTALLKQVEAAEPAFRSPHLYLKEYYLEHGDYENFLIESRKDAALVHDRPALAIAIAAQKGLAANGAKGLFEGILEAQKQLYVQGSVTPFALARTYAELGNRDEALRYLNIAFEKHDESLLSIENTWEFNGLHADPAYRELVERMNLPPLS